MSEFYPNILPQDLKSWLKELSFIAYENVSKIVHFHRHGMGSEMDRWDQEKGFGESGTCFGLTWLLWKRIRKANYECELLLGDKGLQKSNHCALLWHYQKKSFLLDPGFLIFEALELPSSLIDVSYRISPNLIVLGNRESHWSMHSGPLVSVGDPSTMKHRFDFRKTTVTESEFREAWQKTFNLEMMRYPVLTKSLDGVQYYLQKRNLVIRSEKGSETQRLDREGVVRVSKELFGVSESLTYEALEIVTSKYKNFFN